MRRHRHFFCAVISSPLLRIFSFLYQSTHSDQPHIIVPSLLWLRTPGPSTINFHLDSALSCFHLFSLPHLVHQLDTCTCFLSPTILYQTTSSDTNTLILPYLRISSCLLPPENESLVANFWKRPNSTVEARYIPPIIPTSNENLHHRLQHRPLLFQLRSVPSPTIRNIHIVLLGPDYKVNAPRQAS